MAIAHITLEDGTIIDDIDVPEWLAPHVTDFLAAMTVMQAAAVAFAEASAANAVTEAAVLTAEQALRSAQQALNEQSAFIAQNLGG